MIDLIYQKIKPTNVLFGIVLIGIGFLPFTPLATFVPYSYQLSWVSIAAFGLLAFIVTFGKDSLAKLFSKPIKPGKTIAIFLPLSVIVSIISALVLNNIEGQTLKANPIIANINIIDSLSLITKLLGEELLGLFFLLAFASLLLPKIGKRNALFIGQIISAVVFGLLHFWTYNNGNVIQTLIHILGLIGVSRIVFNAAAIRSNSIIISWIIHVLFDYNAIIISLIPIILKALSS